MSRNIFNPLPYAGSLFQQYVVEQFVKMETVQLVYLHLNQSSLRCESYMVLCDASNNHKGPNSVDCNIILPASFTGSPSWYLNINLQGLFAYIYVNLAYQIYSNQQQ